MADEIRPTPRSPIFGLFSDLVNVPLQYMSAPQRTQQMQGLAALIRSTGVPYTLENLSYNPSGRGLFTGAGGLGGTTRLRPEAVEAAMTVAPMVGPAAMVAGRGAMAVGRAGERYAEQVVPQIMERGGLPAEMLGAMGQGTQSPLTVYHGSPYRFGRFDPNKIGAGEGAQSYGYGHYTAEAPGVAEEYQKALAHKGFSKLEEIGRNNYRVTAPDGTVLADGVLRGQAAKVKEAFDKTQAGNLYTIDLPDEAIARMLDWDKPLIAQSPNVRNALNAASENPMLRHLSKSVFDEGDTRGMLDRLSRAWRRDYGKGGEPEVVDVLRQAGIPGIRYLDQGSRGTGAGTSNFVVFPGGEDLLRILDVNPPLRNPIMYEDPFGSTVR
jgi:hypothetical protein